MKIPTCAGHIKIIYNVMTNTTLEVHILQIVFYVYAEKSLEGNQRAVPGKTSKHICGFINHIKGKLVF